MTIPDNYEWFNGIVLNKSHTDFYNLLSTNIQKAIDNNGYTDIIEKMRNDRHRWLVNCFEVYK